MFRLSTPVIEFVTSSDNRGIIPEPYPAVQHLQDWYKKLQHRVGNKGLHKGTVKRCAPFLESMSLGYIIPLAGDVEISMSNGGATVETKSEFYKKIIGLHSDYQLGGESHPSHPSPALKFSNFWAIRVPRGWSVLFVPPLNRPDSRFECFSGVVECDRYWNYVNFPFVMKDLSFTGIIPQGTPMVQAIPFKRSSVSTKPKIGTMSKKDEESLAVTSKAIKAHESYYRDSIWKKCPFHK
jgi:hypothetical protein